MPRPSKSLKTILDQSKLRRKQNNHAQALKIISQAQTLGLTSPWLEYGRVLSLVGQENKHESQQIWRYLSTLDEHQKLKSIAQQALKSMAETEVNSQSKKSDQLITTRALNLKLTKSESHMTQFLSEPNLAVNAMSLRKLEIDTLFVAIHII